MKVSFELDLDHTVLTVWADVLQSFTELVKEHPDRVLNIQSFLDEVMTRALEPGEGGENDDT